MNNTRKFCVAPMLDLTDKHYRYMARILTKKAMLYTEMIHYNAILKGETLSHLEYNSAENPLTLQLGGNEPKKLAMASKIAESLGYDEINLNVGCPSDRVQSGGFGLSLMKNPKLIASCVCAMKSVVNIPISIKCRIGYDEFDSYDILKNFIEIQRQAEVDFICIHARKGWLNGLSPKENRTIPPLNYQRVYDIKSEFSDLQIGINGGIKNLTDANEILKNVDSVMIGRESYNNIMILADVDNVIYGDDTIEITPKQVIEKMYPYIENHLSNSGKLSNITRHMLGLFQGQPGARAFRRYISENAVKKGSGLEVLEKSLYFLKN